MDSAHYLSSPPNNLGGVSLLAFYTGQLNLRLGQGLVQG